MSASARRFFLEQPPHDHGEAWLWEDQAHHVREVLRAKPGDGIVVFDGSGKEWDAEIVEVSGRGKRASVQLRLTSDPRYLPRESRVPVTIAVALPKSRGEDMVFEKATELGVARILPLQTTRSVVKLQRPLPDSRRRRLEAIFIEACKQCGRNRPPTLGVPLDVAELGRTPAALRLVADPSASISLCEALPADPPTDVLVAIGPEGGFTDAEVAELSAAGFLPISLGPRLLRVETAVLAVQAMISGRYDGENHPG